MNNRTINYSKWVVALLNDNMTEEISINYGNTISDNTDYCQTLDKLLSIQFKKVLNNEKLLDNALTTIDEEFTRLKLATVYGELSSTHNFFKNEVLAMKNYKDPNDYFEGVYNRYEDEELIYLKVAIYYALLQYALDTNLIEGQLDKIQKINNYLSDKGDITIRNNAYCNVMQLILLEVKK